MSTWSMYMYVYVCVHMCVWFFFFGGGGVFLQGEGVLLTEINAKYHKE